MNKAVPDNFKVKSEEKELLKKHLCRNCEMKLDSLEIKDLVDIMHKFCYSYWGKSRQKSEEAPTALEAQIKRLRHIEIDGEDYVECMNKAELYSYPYYERCTNSYAVSELYPLNSSCREWLKV